MIYNTISIEVFSKQLKESLSERVEKFSKHMEEKFKNNPESSTLKSKQDWMVEYQKWIVAESIKKSCIDYIGETQ